MPYAGLFINIKLMFTYNLKEDRKRDRAVYAPALSLRILCAVFAFFIGLGLILNIISEGFVLLMLIPIAVLLILLLTALLRDEWSMDNNKRCFTYIFGLGPFVKKEVFSYDDIKRIEVTHFLKGLPDDTTEKPSWKHKAFVVLSFRMRGDEMEIHELEIMPEKKSAGKLERIANLIAAYTGLELYIDRARDERVDLKRVF